MEREIQAIQLLLADAGDRNEVEVDDVTYARFMENRKTIYFKYIFPNFRWNDLLRFRRVCKVAKELVDSYIKEGAGVRMCPQITIFETTQNKERNMERYLELGFPTSKIYVMNTSGVSMYERDREHFLRFIRDFGANVKSLRVNCMVNYPMGMEWTFLDGLSHLETLEVDRFDGVTRTEEEAKMLANSVNLRFSSTFKKIKKLTIGVHENVLSMNVIIASRIVMDECKHLEYAGDAFCSFIKMGQTKTDRLTLGFTFNMIQSSIKKERSRLKYYDFAGFYEDKLCQDRGIVWLNVPDFLNLAMVCAQKGVKLYNVNGGWLQHERKRELDWNTVSIPVVSMINIHGMNVIMDMPNLEKLIIPATSKSCLFPGIWKTTRKPWAKLKSLEVTVDSMMLYTMMVAMDVQHNKAICLDAESTASLIRFLFEEIERPALQEVTLKFAEGVKMETATRNVVDNLGKCCPNLRKLVLINWPGKSEELKKALKELPLLEELNLKKCKFVGNDAFELNTLKNLKKLSLTKLEQMTGITDLFFKQVLCNLQLTHLTLGSGKALGQITREGIRALLDSKFGESIEHFPFHGWSLAKVSKGDFQKLGSEFRSSQML